MSEPKVIDSVLRFISNQMVVSIRTGLMNYLSYFLTYLRYIFADRLHPHDLVYHPEIDLITNEKWVPPDLVHDPDIFISKNFYYSIL